MYEVEQCAQRCCLLVGIGSIFVMISQAEVGESQLDTIERTADESKSARATFRIGFRVIRRLEEAAAFKLGLVDEIAAPDI